MLLEPLHEVLSGTQGSGPPEWGAWAIGGGGRGGHPLWREAPADDVAVIIPTEQALLRRERKERRHGGGVGVEKVHDTEPPQSRGRPAAAAAARVEGNRAGAALPKDNAAVGVAGEDLSHECNK